MDEHAVVATRRSLHAVAERLLAGPQYREHGEIRLQVTPGGFGQFAGPLRVEGAEIVGADTRVPLRGSIGDVEGLVDPTADLDVVMRCHIVSRTPSGTRAALDGDVAAIESAGHRQLPLQGKDADAIDEIDQSPLFD